MKKQKQNEQTPPRGRVNRRDFLALLGGGAALAASGALVSCERKPRRQIVSYSKMPEYQKPGQPLYYASTWTEGNTPYGILVKTVDGRPIKIEGNPKHPVNRGASNAQMQAGVMGLYDPERLRAPQRGGESISWDEADKEIVAKLKEAKSVVLVTRSNLGPSERALVKKFLEVKPGARHFVYEPFHDGPRRSTWAKIFGSDGELITRYDKAKVILSVGSDFLGTDGPTLEAIRQFSEGRQPTPEHPEMNRLYMVEGALTLTGSNADHRLALRPTKSGQFLRALQALLEGSEDITALIKDLHMDEKFLKTLAEDLKSHQGEALIVAGPHLPETIHAQVALLNQTLRAYGKTLFWNPQPATLPVDDMKEILESNPDGGHVLISLGTYWEWKEMLQPIWLKERNFLRAAKISISHFPMSIGPNDAYTYKLPSSHNLESWNDASSRPGLQSLCQPVQDNLYGARQEAESLLKWTKALAPTDPYFEGIENWRDFIMAEWKKKNYLASGSPRSFEGFWKNALQEGVLIRNLPDEVPRLNLTVTQSLVMDIVQAQGLDIVMRPHHSVRNDGQSNLQWLRELPDPTSKMVWDSAAYVSPRTAKELGIQQGEILELLISVYRPLFIQDGMADDTIAVSFLPSALSQSLSKRGYHGYGGDKRRIQTTGFLTKSHTPLLGVIPAPKIVGRKISPVTSQKESSMHGRPLALEGTLDEYKRDPHFVSHLRHLPKPAKIHTEFDYSTRNRWGMVIDLSKCVGCSHCVVACQAENNVPAVGREECEKGREMQWMRIDRYIDEEADGLRVRHQPVVCMHCENAPCENVCPVAATTHSPDGLNEMTYNRCVGTRYCANNCPYKVRRFNFFNYSKRFIGPDNPQRLAYNPQVTVRTRGVMEKCTYCVQRITEARHKAKRREAGVGTGGAEQKKHPSGSALAYYVPDGSLQTACQQACPARAIVFGDLNDPESRVAKLRASNRNYALLAELNTKPRTTYLAKIRNPHPDLVKGDKDKNHKEEKKH